VIIEGRAGIGAVMGSKNLFGVAVMGRGKVVPADPAASTAALRTAMKVIRESRGIQALMKHGTMGDYVANSVAGDFPTKNWRPNFQDRAEAIYEAYAANNLIRNASCHRGCPVACGRVVHVIAGERTAPISLS